VYRRPMGKTEFVDGPWSDISVVEATNGTMDCPTMGIRTRSRTFDEEGVAKCLSVGFEVFEATDGDGGPDFPFVFSTDVQISGVVKWDGCMHVDFPGFSHLCGPDGVSAMAAVLTRAYALAADRLTSLDFERPTHS